MRFFILLAVASLGFAQTAPKPVRSVTPIQLASSGSRTGFFAPEAGLAAGINVKSLRASEAGKRAAQEWSGASTAAGWDLFGPLLADLDEVWVSLDPSRKNSQPLVMLVGRFQNPLWAQVLQTNTAIDGANALLIGEPLAVAGARRRLRTGATAAHPLAAYSRSLASAGDLWIAGVPAMFPSAMAGPHASAADVARDVSRFALVIGLSDRLNLDLSLDTTSAKAADRLMLLYAAARSQFQAAPDPDLDLIAQNLTVEKQDNGVRFSLSLDPETVSSIARKRTAALPRFPPARQADPPPQRRSVTIYGMEGGPREIPYAPPK